jgi:hypothetical protein
MCSSSVLGGMLGATCCLHEGHGEVHTGSSIPLHLSPQALSEGLPHASPQFPIFEASVLQGLHSLLENPAQRTSPGPLFSTSADLPLLALPVRNFLLSLPLGDDCVPLETHTAALGLHLELSRAEWAW